MFVFLADTLGVPVLARDLEAVLREVRSRTVPDFIREPAPGPFRIISASYRGRRLAGLVARLDAGLPKAGAAALRARLWPRHG